MERTWMWTLALLAALMTAPAVAADGDPPASGEAEDGPCDLFWYTLDPPGYRVDPGCLPIPLPN